MNAWELKTVLLSTVLAVAPIHAAELKGLKIDGEKFTFNDGTWSVQGIIVKPGGKGPFPGLLISHGLGGTGEQFGMPKAREFAKLGYVCIAPDYTHGRVKGNRKEFGASAENIKRAKKCLDILESLPEVDVKRLHAYGNSMGAFLTVGLAAEENRLKACAITAGGIVDATGMPAPSKESAAKIKAPFIIFHGTTDTTVPPERSKLLEDVLKACKVECARHLYDGVAHNLHNEKAKDVNAKMDEWFKQFAGKK